MNGFRTQSALRDHRHTPGPIEHRPFGIVQAFIVGALVAVGLAMLYGHLSANDDAVVPGARAKCQPARAFEDMYSYDIDGGRTHCVYVRRVAGIQPGVRRELAQ